MTTRRICLKLKLTARKGIISCVFACLITIIYGWTFQEITSPVKDYLSPIEETHSVLDIQSNEIFNTTIHFNTETSSGSGFVFTETDGEFEFYPSPLKSPFQKNVVVSVFITEKNGPIKDDIYFLNLLSLVYSLKHHDVTKVQNITEVAVIVTEAISSEKRRLLVLLGARLIIIKSMPFKGYSESTDQWKNCYTKLYMFKMTFYEKILYMDADITILKPLDRLFVTHFQKETNQYFFGAVQDWKLEAGIFNAGLMLFDPSIKIFNDLKSLVNETDKYNSAMMEQGLLNWYFQRNNIGPGNQSWHELSNTFHHQWINERPTQEALDASILHFKIWIESIQHEVYVIWRNNLIHVLQFLSSQSIQLDLDFIPETQALFRKQLDKGLLGKAPVKHSFSKNQTIAIYTLVAGTDIGKSYDVPRIIANRERFSKKWKHDHIEQTTMDNVRFPVWQKVYDAEKYVEKYDWIWFFDSDAFIMNGDISLHDLLQKYQQEADQEVDIIIANDCNGFNAGSFFIRKSNWTIDFIQKWKAMEYRDDFPNAALWREQAALVHLYNINELQAKEHIYIVPQKDINSYAGSYCGHGYQPGDLVVHSPGMGYHNGVEAFLNNSNFREY